ncbi:Ig-like domain-containing protein [Phytomonospora endophytica]|uniref:Bacterial Ig-like domain-containing protein n=1 Tax=Phytomonospora endophytica TaxID=714109 RepID=A0A841FBQ9_9ACTN|nr:Ig-like domain-containing protein [Phytomonospora endophytica]MBB6032443.1 hypothetical protein [Phytomonospora endophytica]GIG66410.1 hypothetical protein Pen01_27050 [Phytomonospora endophytica]
MRTRLTRITTVLAATAAALLALFLTASPAHAESPILGTLTLSATSGTVTDTPFVASATTTGSCPAGYGDNTALRVGPVGGPYNLLGRIGGDGGYDNGQAITLAASRSLSTVLGGPPADGTYEVVITCSGVLTGVNAKAYSTYIAVTGANWALKEATATTTTVSGSTHIAKLGKPVTLTARVAPANNGSVSFTDGTTALGSASVANGKATITTTSLTAGWHYVGASFTPDDARTHRSSTAACGWWIYVTS